MPRQKSASTDAARLRRRAEERLARRPGEALGNGADTQQLWHELQIRKIELEIQNGELEGKLASTACYADLYDLAPVACYTLGYDGSILQANIGGAGLLGVVRSRLKHQSFATFVSDEALSVFEDFLSRVFARQLEEKCELTLRPGASRPPLIVRMAAVADDGGKTCNMVAFDITERKQSEVLLREREARYARVLEGSDQGFWDWNLKNQQFDVSARFESMLGYAEGEWLIPPAQWTGHVHPDDFARLLRSIDQHIKGLTSCHEVELRCRTKSGEWKWVLTRGRIVARDEDGSPMIMSGTHTDISERKRLEAELMALATSDYLTGLPNRRHFFARMEEELARIRRKMDQTVAVLMIDLDHFKRINDTHGHAMGDAVLMHFAALLRDELRRSDTAGRIGGEEFAILLSGADIASANLFAERLRLKVAETPLRADGRVVPVTISIGIAAMNASDPHTDAALMRADEALYRAKEGGRNRVAVAAQATG